MKLLSPGTKLRSTREFHNIFDGTTVPKNAPGVVVAAGADAAFGWYNMRFTYHVNGIFAEHNYTGNLTDVAEVIS